MSGSLTMNYVSRVGVVVLMALGLIGCSGLGVGSKTVSAPEEAKDVVAGLAAARWDALIHGDIAKAYAYFSPGKREVLTLDSYKSQIRLGRWKKASVDSVSCDQGICKVTVKLDYVYRDMPIETPLVEDWLQVDGKWWYSPPK